MNQTAEDPWGGYWRKVDQWSDSHHNTQDDVVAGLEKAAAWVEEQA